MIFVLVKIFLYVIFMSNVLYSVTLNIRRQIKLKKSSNFSQVYKFKKKTTPINLLNHNLVLKFHKLKKTNR